MKTETKFTKGEWAVKINHESIWVESPLWHVAYISPKTTKEETEANAKLIAEAGKVANETGKTPRQLADENKMLLEALTEISNCKNRLDYHSDKKLLEFVIELSNNATKKATI